MLLFLYKNQITDKIDVDQFVRAKRFWFYAKSNKVTNPYPLTGLRKQVKLPNLGYWKLKNLLSTRNRNIPLRNSLVRIQDRKVFGPFFFQDDNGDCKFCMIYVAKFLVFGREKIVTILVPARSLSTSRGQQLLRTIFGNRYFQYVEPFIGIILFCVYKSKSYRYLRKKWQYHYKEAPEVLKNTLVEQFLIGLIDIWPLHEEQSKHSRQHFWKKMKQLWSLV